MRNTRLLILIVGMIALSSLTPRREVDAAGAATVSGGAAMNATTCGFQITGQPIVGRAANGSVVMMAGLIPTLIACQPEPVPGDCDGDGDVDLADFTGLAACFTGPGGRLPSDCACFDLDHDGHVDLADLIAFQAVFTGAQ